MEVTATAKVLEAVAGGGANFSPETLTILGGVVLAHISKPVAAAIPEKLASVKPLLLGAAHVALAAGSVSLSTGTPFVANLSTGLVAAASAKIYQLGILKEGSVLNTFLTSLLVKKA